MKISNRTHLIIGLTFIEKKSQLSTILFGLFLYLSIYLEIINFRKKRYNDATDIIIY